jgi:uncharacterized protein YegP (UPF0339 family)
MCKTGYTQKYMEYKHENGNIAHMSETYVHKYEHKCGIDMRIQSGSKKCTYIRMVIENIVR